jgi:hypothetical protein
MGVGLGPSHLGRNLSFENRALRKIFWPAWDEVAGNWKRLHNEELYVLYPHQTSFL